MNVWDLHNGSQWGTGFSGYGLKTDVCIPRFLVDKLDPSEDQENKTLEELNAESWIIVFNRTVLNFDQ